MFSIKPDLSVLGAGVALALMAATPSLAADKITWDAKFFNPQKTTGDLVLPMPCGAAMTFRRIDTPTSDSPLDDIPLVLGYANPETDYSEFVRPDAVAGSFFDKSAARRYMLFGKYEVTRDQYAAVTGDSCPIPSNQGRVAAASISWIDAVEFTNRYSTWLFKEAMAVLPGRGRAHAFVRLPTEAEWEFAARGGTAVQESEFRERLFPMKDDIAKYAWFEGARSSNGQLRPIGLLLPNPLGLYDIIGNASEIVLDPYRLNKVGRLHGQVGGILVKGGDFQTPGDSLRTAMRLEYPPFDEATGEPTRLPTVGFRVILALPVVTDMSETVTLQKSFKDLSASKLSNTDDPDQLLQSMIAKTEDPIFKGDLQQVANALRSETRARAEQEDQAAKNFIRMGATLIRTIRDYDKRLVAMRNTYDDMKKRVTGKPKLEREVEGMSQMVSGLQANLDSTVKLYVDNLIETSKYDDRVINDQAATVISEYQQQQRSKMPAWVKMFVVQQAAYRKTSHIDTKGWLAEILK